ncbi:SHOCT domain-containing protein [Streptomyces triticisoli]|uniref:SHOCT domain-containing protein n=1 Tax=Streptomyces triticisoli TaxID=2182797 RepID=UPI0018E4F753|nr:SHOCT domain-containing protein [Streptomyces triticisoli]
MSTQMNLAYDYPLLGAFWARGDISDEEFARAKAMVLSGGAAEGRAASAAAQAPGASATSTPGRR